MSSDEPTLLIVSLQDDLHAYAAKHDIEARGRVRCAIAASDALAGSGGLTWTLTEPGERSVPLVDGSGINPADVDAIWWRRHSRRQSGLSHIQDQAEKDVIENDCYSTLVGMVDTSFTGTWISSPTATTQAENKLVQLQAATRVGLTLPETLVSQSPKAIRAFHDSMPGGTVVKPVRGTHRVPLLTQRVLPAHLENDASLAAAPAIYQRLIPGTKHLRLLVLGTEVFGAQLDCSDLDWRPRLDSAIAPTQVDPALGSALVRLLDVLDLRMGVCDVKIDETTGEPIFLEVNPQGQFLFVEGLGGGDMRTPIADYLEAETLKASTENSTRAAGMSTWAVA